LTDKGHEMTRFTLGHLVGRIGIKAGVPDSNPYRFRHTFAIQYLRNGGDVFTLQRILGHATMEMTRKYLMIAGTDVATAHKRASPVDNWKL
jgi:integrase/recombinase XerD